MKPRTFFSRVALTFALAGALVSSSPGVAQACGGCFTPPPVGTESASSVTDHRMVFSVSARQTTLWDQFSYSGRPEDFVWVLPIANAANVRIGLADQAFMDALDEFSAAKVTGAYAACFPVSSSPSSGGLMGCGAGNAAGGFGMMPGMDSTRVGADGNAVVGPYAITVLGGHMGGAVDRWLADNGFRVPPETRSAIEYYTSLEFDFVVLRLRPGAGVNQMQPVRVTTRGYSPVLPLRMVAAGVGDSVGLTLMVIASSRMEAQNFRNAEVDDDDLTYDVRANRSNWREVYARAIGRVPGRTWVTESVQNLPIATLTYGESRPPMVMPPVRVEDGGGWMPGADAGPMLDFDVAMPGEDVTAWDASPLFDGASGPLPPDANTNEPDALGEDVALADGANPQGETGSSDGSTPIFDLEGGTMANDDGGMTMTAPDGGWSAPVAYIDRTYAFSGLGASAVVTRMRTDLRQAELSTDLILDASSGGLRPARYVGTVINGPQCPRGFGTCSIVGTTTPVALEAGFVVLLVYQWRRRAARRRAKKRGA